MKRHTFLPLHQGDCVEETPCVVERLPIFVSGDDRGVRGEILPDSFAYRLVSHSPRCRCGEPLIHVDPSQAQLRTAWHLNEAEDV